MVELDFPEEIKIYENQVSKRIPNNKKVNNHLSLIVEVTILLGCIIMSFNSNVYGTRILLLFFSFLLLFRQHSVPFPSFQSDLQIRLHLQRP